MSDKPQTKAAALAKLRKRVRDLGFDPKVNLQNEFAQKYYDYDGKPYYGASGQIIGDDAGPWSMRWVRA